MEELHTCVARYHEKIVFKLGLHLIACVLKHVVCHYVGEIVRNGVILYVGHKTCSVTGFELARYQLGSCYRCKGCSHCFLTCCALRSAYFCGTRSRTALRNRYGLGTSRNHTCYKNNACNCCIDSFVKMSHSLLLSSYRQVQPPRLPYRQDTSRCPP